jgi:chromosome segregation ATPase
VALSDVVAQRVKNEVVLLRAELRQRSEDITALEKQVTELRNENDRLEQYSRRNSIRITIIPEKKNEDVTETVLQLVNETLALTPRSQSLKSTACTEWASPPQKRTINVSRVLSL